MKTRNVASFDLGLAAHSPEYFCNSAHSNETGSELVASKVSIFI